MTYSEAAYYMTIFVISPYGVVEKTNLFDHIAKSATMVTARNGITTKLLVSQGENGCWDLKEWSARNNDHSIIISSFETQEEANDAWLDRIERIDFQMDDQRDTSYYMTREEAIEKLKSL